MSAASSAPVSPDSSTTAGAVFGDSPEQPLKPPVSEGRILFWMCVLIGVNQLGFGAMIPVLPLYAQSFGVSQFDIGLAVAVYGAARFVVAVPTGQLADWLGRRPALALGGVVSAVGNLWSAVADTYPEFIIARFVSGGGAALVLTAGAVVLADITTPERRGRMMAMYQGTFLFAVGIGPLPGGLLAEHYGLATPFYAYAALAIVAGLVAWFAVAETRDFGGGSSKTSGMRMSLRHQLGTLMRQSGFRLVSLVGLIHALTRTGGLFAIVPLLGHDRIGLSASQIGFGMALGSLMGLLVSYPAGVLADRYGRKMVIVPATVVTGIAMGMFSIAPGYTMFIAACVLWSMAGAAGASGPAAYAADCAPPGMNAAAMSSFRSISDLGYVIGPIALGWLADAAGVTVAVGCCALMLVLVAITFGVFAPETHRRRS